MKTLIFWLAMVAFLSLYPFHVQAGTPAWTDKAIHFILYAITVTISYVTIKGVKRTFVRGNALLLSLIGASAFGLALEFIQPYTHRSFEWADAGMNALGALAAAAYIAYARRKGAQSI